MAYNFAKRLKTLHGLTPWEFIVKSWNLHSELFKIKSNPYKLGLNTKKYADRDKMTDEYIRLMEEVMTENDLIKSTTN